MRRAALAAAAIAWALLAIACGGDDAADGGGSGSGGSDHDAGSLAWQDVYDDVILKRCSDAVCHGGGAGKLDMSSADAAYGALVDVDAMGPECGDTGLTRVVPGHAEDSLLYQKLSGGSVCGRRMPIGGGLEPDELLRIEAWIEAGATRD